MNTSLIPIEHNQRHILENLFPYYIYDMSEYMGWNPNESGQFTYDNRHFDVYWQRDDHLPFFIDCDGELAGFVLIRKYPSNPERNDIAQFFVLRKFKRKGVGKQILKRVLNTYPGLWQVRVLKENLGALSFWKQALSESVECAIEQSLDKDGDRLMHFLTFEVLR